MPINPNTISWDNTPKVAPKTNSIEWDGQPSQEGAPAAKPGYYSDGSYDYHNVNPILGWLQAADRSSGRAADRLAGGIGRFGQGILQNVGVPQGVSDFFGSAAATNEQQAAEPVPGAVQWDDVKAHPSVGNIASYIGQSALGATPDLALASVAPWAYGASRTGEVAHGRAMNNGRGDDMNLGDLAIAAPVAAADTALMRYGLGGMFGGEGMGILKGTMRAAGRDAVMGAGQPVLDYAGETVGTNQPFDWNEAGDRALAGAVSLAPFGAAMHLASRGRRAMSSKDEPGPSPEQALSVRDQLSPEQADALTLHGVDVDMLTDVNVARNAADRLIARNAPAPEAEPVIATRHGNIAPNADEVGRQPETARANGGDERAAFEARVGGAENATGDHNAKNPRSSASGDFQFTNGTFVDYYRKRFGQKESRESILAKKNDPQLQNVLMRDLTNDNEAALRHAGIPLTAGNYYLAHFAGSDGAVKLHQHPDADAESILGHKAIEANPFLKGMTGRDVVEWASGKMHGATAMGPRAAGFGLGENAGTLDLDGHERDSTIYRAPDFSDTEGHYWDAADRPQRLAEPGAHDTGTMGDFENTGTRQSKTAEELAQPGARGEGMATGGMGRPFKADPNERGPEFENVQRDRVKQAEAERETRWERRRAEAERMKAEFEANRNRAGQSDASSRYQTFGSKPHYDPNMGAFRTTGDGFVADEAGNPVVWPSQGAAAKWAARFKMGGDFELQAHGTSARDGEQRVTLQRKPGSTYGAADVKPHETSTPQIEHIEWHQPAGESPPVNGEGGDLSAGAKGNDEGFPGDQPRYRPTDPGREPSKPRNFMASVASHLAERSKKAGVNVRVDAEDAINHGVPAEYIYHDPSAKYPTVKANAAKVFTSSKAPLTSRARPVKMISLDDLGDRFNPRDFGKPGDEIHGTRLEPEHAGDLLRQSFEKDAAARDQNDPRFDTHREWEARMDELEEFERRYGDNWQSLSDGELDAIDRQLDGALGDLHDDVIHAAETGGEIDPFDPRFWDTNDGRTHPNEVHQPEAESRGRDDLGQRGRDAGEQAQREAGPAHRDGVEFSRRLDDGQQRDAFGERPGDQRRALERKADEPLRGTKKQKAPGEDGGLFDDASHGKQGTLLEIGDETFGKLFRDLPRNNIPPEVLKDRMEVDRALNWVRENTSDDFHRDLADRLIDLTEGVKLRLYDSDSMRTRTNLDAGLRSAHGAVTHEDGQAVLWLNKSKYGHGLTEETLLHEAIHAAIATRIGTLRDGVSVADHTSAKRYGQDLRRIEVLQRHVWQHATKLDRTGGLTRGNFAYETINEIRIAAENPDEFVTYALTSKEFQRFLQGIEMPDVHSQTTRLTAWQHFVNIARRLVGLDPKYTAQFEKVLDAGNALDQVGQMANGLLDRMDETPAVKQTAEGAAKITGRTSFEAERRHDERSVVDRVKDTAKALLTDERGSLDLDAVAKFFVDTDAMREAKDGFKSLGARLKGTTARSVLTKTLDLMDHNRLVPSYFFSIDARMRGLAKRFNSPTIGKLADMFHARAGMADGTARTYHEAVEFNSKRWNKVLFDTLHPFAGDDAAMERIRNIIARTGSGSKEETAAATRIAAMLKEIHDYRLDAGEDIGEVSDGYFPRILDPELVVAKPDEFKTLAEGLFTAAGVSAKDAKVRAELWFHQVVNENAGLDGAILDVRRAKAPGTTSGLSRKLGKEADKVLAKFYQKDPLDVLSSYITGSAKRAEFTRRFGMVGREGSKERADWTAAHGTKDQLDVMRKSINDEILASDRDAGDAQDLINSLLEANLGILGKASRTMRLGTSLAHAYNQIGKMDHSLITSLNELAMGFVRGGPVGGVKYLGTTVKEFARELMHMEPSEARRYAEHLGLILNPLMDQVLQSRISATEGTRGINKVVSRFYKAIGLHQFTEAERIGAAKMAREHLNVLAGDLASSNTRTVRRAERALAELGVTDPAAFKSWLEARSGKVRFGEIDADKGMAAKWSTAVARMTDQTVMNATRAVKPLWANHPVGSLLYGLMSYTFAFKKNVLDRAGRMAVRGVKERDAHLLMPMLFGLPILAAFTYINDTYVRPSIFGSTYDFASETAPMGVLRAIDRSSMDGALSPLVNVMFGTKYNRSLSEAFTGSFFGSVAQGVEKIAVNPLKAKIEGTQGNGADRQAAGAIYDLFLEPAFDGALAGAVGGKVATAGIYASGTRPNSAIFPSDREAFIDAWAGPPSDKAKSPFDEKGDFDKAFKDTGGAEFDKAMKDAGG